MANEWLMVFGSSLSVVLSMVRPSEGTVLLLPPGFRRQWECRTGMSHFGSCRLAYKE
jgi:hypothetical protein